MKPSEVLHSYRTEIRSIALSHRTTNVRVFGSAARGEDTDGSDLDLLVDPTKETTLMDSGAIRFELNRLLHVQVDVITPRALPLKFRQQVIDEAIPV